MVLKPIYYADIIRKKLAFFLQWEQLNHSEDYLIYLENIGEHLSIDEVRLSKGELYTFVTNLSSINNLLEKRQKRIR